MTDTVAVEGPRKGNGASAEELLKQAVSGPAKGSSGKPPEGSDKISGPDRASPDAAAASKPVDARLRAIFGRLDGRAAVLGGAALSLGLVVGAGGTAQLVSRGDVAAATLSQVRAEIDAVRAEMTKMAGEIGRLAGTVVKSSERATEDVKAVRTDLTQRAARLEQTLATKITTLADKQEAWDREQSARIASLGTLIEKRSAGQAVTVPAVAPQAAKTATPDPIQTGSIAESKSADAKPNDAKPKPAVVANWAVREVYDGIAVLEDRKRRLVEVGRGDMIPGVGRTEAIERRGRNWVVVTKDGLITPQDW